MQYEDHMEYSRLSEGDLIGPLKQRKRNVIFIFSKTKPSTATATGGENAGPPPEQNISDGDPNGVGEEKIRT